MRRLVCWSLLCFAACSSEATPPELGSGANESRPRPGGATTPVQADANLHVLAMRALDGTLPPSAHAVFQREPDAAVAAILDTAARSDPVAQGNAPVLLARLGGKALPGLQRGLAHEDPVQRRVAVLALLQLGRIAEPAAAALAAARDDADPAVRAAAEHAYRRAIGDTSALDELRRAHEAAQPPNR